MTGYGSAKHSESSSSIHIEVKTLNSKFLDANLRYPKALSEYELEIRNMISQKLERGKVSLSIDLVNESETVLKQKYNKELFIKYYRELESLASEVEAPKDELFRAALNSPDVVVNSNQDEDDAESFEKVKTLISKALDDCNIFRLKEGAVLEEKFNGYISSINNALSAVIELDPARIERIRTRIKSNLGSFIEEENIDKNRLEQELVFYIEKLDITEEKVRLKNHLNHFIEVINAKASAGKKLGFISQEIGREINTIGSKANDSDIQKHVVTMKEELEKIKEQLLNVL